ncbi:hypothetical protein J3Q64DRAFT_1077474 [Phycomyces blakesleeanus]|uniref:Uncharacterized protein n=1 Tax=Phycomyces blakesleeanus TaxID=4837 RepID=A0ABR3BG87_PHYBL
MYNSVIVRNIRIRIRYTRSYIAYEFKVINSAISCSVYATFFLELCDLYSVFYCMTSFLEFFGPVGIQAFLNVKITLFGRCDNI